jgi:F420-dependent oxidoreductase-like protein
MCLLRGALYRNARRERDPVSLFFGYHLPNFTFPGAPRDQIFDRILKVAETAEGAGFDMVTVMDHLYQINGIGSEDEPMLEAYATLSAIAARTSRVKLATLVTGVTYRNPALLAKTVTSLDVISHGRAILGLGAAWNEDEHRGYGFEFPPIRERMDRLDEALTIARLMFSEVRPTFEGRHYRIERALNSPRPIQPGGPKILVGGSGETRTLRIAARHADYTNWLGSLDFVIGKDKILLRHCEAERRDPSTITRTITFPMLLAETEREARNAIESVEPHRRPLMPPGTPEQAADFIRPYVDAGYRAFIFRTIVPTTPEAVLLAAEVKRLLA